MRQTTFCLLVFFNSLIACSTPFERQVAYCGQLGPDDLWVQFEGLRVLAPGCMISYRDAVPETTYSDTACVYPYFECDPDSLHIILCLAEAGMVQVEQAYVTGVEISSMGPDTDLSGYFSYHSAWEVLPLDGNGYSFRMKPLDMDNLHFPQYDKAQLVKAYFETVGGYLADTVTYPPMALNMLHEESQREAEDIFERASDILKAVEFRITTTTASGSKVRYLILAIPQTG